MADRTRIFDRGGRQLADTRATVARNWMRNRQGRADFTLSWLDPDNSDYVLNFGNYILVEHDKLPAWIGVIDAPDDWKRRRKVINAYTLERVFEYRRGNSGETLSGSPGVIFYQMLQRINAAEQTIIVPGEIYDDGTIRQQSLLSETMAGNLKTMQERVGQDYDFTYDFVGGRLVVYANWYARLGRKIDFMLEESVNISDDQYNYSRQGDIHNDITGYGQGASSATRPQANVSDALSRDKYGLREAAIVYSDVTALGTVQQHILDELNTAKQPENVFTVSALDKYGTWENMRIGNQMAIRFWSLGYGIRANIGIEGMYHNPLDGKVDLTAKEIFNDSTG